MDAWLRRNLETQGYSLSDAERRALRVGLRFSTGLCLPFVAVGLALESIPLLLGAVAIAVVAGFSARHPFDYLWNGLVRHALQGPPLPPNPQRRRHAFKIGTAMLAIVVTLFALGANSAAVVLGVFLLVACVSVTAFNVCLPSETLALIERVRGREVVQDRVA